MCVALHLDVPKAYRVLLLEAVSRASRVLAEGRAMGSGRPTSLATQRGTTDSKCGVV